MHIFSRIGSAQSGMRNAKPFQIIFSSQCRLLFLKCNISLSLHFISLQSPFSHCYFGVPGGTILFVSTTHIFAIGVVLAALFPINSITVFGMWGMGWITGWGEGCLREISDRAGV